MGSFHILGEKIVLWRWALVLTIAIGTGTLPLLFGMRGEVLKPEWEGLPLLKRQIYRTSVASLCCTLSLSSLLSLIVPSFFLAPGGGEGGGVVIMTFLSTSVLCVDVSMCVRTYAYRGKREVLVFSSMALHFVSWDRVAHWYFAYIYWSASHRDPSFFSMSVLGLKAHTTIPSFFFFLRKKVWVLRMWMKILMVTK